MANRGYDSAVKRFDMENGGGSTKRRREVHDPTGDPMASTTSYSSRAETRGGQFRRGGWDKYEVPTHNGGTDVEGLVEAYARGGNADTHLSADYPGGSTGP
jgi:hypothetical protein